ncbi:MAG: GIY-YIG nuclease family protein, partial [Chitinophagaceae bacterium]
YCYIIFSEKLNKYYVGACINLERRLAEHNIGHSKFTSTGVPWKLVYKEMSLRFLNPSPPAASA